jgi:hypothetical protein
MTTRLVQYVSEIELKTNEVPGEQKQGRETNRTFLLDFLRRCGRKRTELAETHVIHVVILSMFHPSFSALTKSETISTESALVNYIQTLQQ